MCTKVKTNIHNLVILFFNIHIIMFWKGQDNMIQLQNLSYIKRMRDLREDNDKTQTEIAAVLGTSQTMYARYERGANELPIHHLLTLCRYYKVSADYFLGLSDKA